MKKRATSEDEKILFRKTVERSNPRVVMASKPKKAAKKVAGSELDGHTKARLKRGNQEPEARVDLHGQTEQGAYKALKSFVQRAHKKGARLALVITGNGAALKPMVPRWLNQPEFAAFVTGTAPAHVRHGGAGALYVYLKR